MTFIKHEKRRPERRGGQGNQVAEANERPRGGLLGQCLEGDTGAEAH